MKYFIKQWVDSNSEWYEGYAVGFPSTKNALESTNRLIKDQSTHRERKLKGEFLSILEEKIIQKWSVSVTRLLKLIHTLQIIPRSHLMCGPNHINRLHQMQIFIK